VNLTEYEDDIQKKIDASIGNELIISSIHEDSPLISNSMFESAKFVNKKPIKSR